MYSYDLDAFAREMDKLGWKKGDDGIYERDGQKFSFTIQVRDYEEERVDIANVLARQLKKAGVDMKIALVTKFDWNAGYNGFLAGFAAEFDPDGVYKDFVTGASDNTMAYSDPKVDELLKQGRTTEDPAERKKIYGDFEVAYAERPGHLLVAYLNGNYVGIPGPAGSGHLAGAGPSRRGRHVEHRRLDAEPVDRTAAGPSGTSGAAPAAFSGHRLCRAPGKTW